MRITGEYFTLSIQLPPVTAYLLAFAKAVCEIVRLLVTVLSPIISVELIMVDVKPNLPITKCLTNVNRAYGIAPGLLTKSANFVVSTYRNSFQALYKLRCALLDDVDGASFFQLYLFIAFGISASASVSNRSFAACRSKCQQTSINPDTALSTLPV